jgi:membrane protease YdiL (CAAX protease family)
MNQLRNWIKRHQLLSFLVLCNVWFWLALLPLMLLRIDVLEILMFSGLFSPVISGILISRISEPDRVEGRRGVRWAVFAVAWVVSTLAFVLNAQVTGGVVAPVTVAIFALFGLFPAWAISSAFSPVSGVRKNLSSLVRPTGHWVWYLLALLYPPISRWLGVVISDAMGWARLSAPAPIGGLALVRLASIYFLYTALYAGGLNEEGGWTAFALPRFQSRFSPLVASIFLWFFWIAWHAPAHLAGYWTGTLQILVSTFFARFIFTWLYNGSRGGVLTAILLHASANVASQFIPVTYGVLIVEAVAAVFGIVSGRMWQKLPQNHSIQRNEHTYA